MTRTLRLVAPLLLFTTLALLSYASSRPAAQTTLPDDSDRAAFRSWFTFLADAQFERKTSDVTDCASLVRHAYREALRAHTPEWYRRNQLPIPVSFPDVRTVPPAAGGAWLLFRIGSNPDRFAEFADAATLVQFNTRPLGRDTAVARPGDLLFFRQTDSDHLMVFVGTSRFDPSRHDWLVYHTGPVDDSPGEVRKASLADLRRHPAPRWRPDPTNPAFAGVFRLSALDSESRIPGAP